MNMESPFLKMKAERILFDIARIVLLSKQSSYGSKMVAPVIMNC